MTEKTPSPWPRVVCEKCREEFWAVTPHRKCFNCCKGCQARMPRISYINAPIAVIPGQTYPDHE